MININNIQAKFQGKENELCQIFLKVLTSGQFILGEEVKKFEGNFAKYTGTNYCITCGNGTDALELGLSEKICVTTRRIPLNYPDEQ